MNFSNIKKLLVAFLITGMMSFIYTGNNTPNINPIQEKDLIKISSEYGMRTHPISKEKKMHNGVDLIAELGTPVMTTADGTVISIEYSTVGYGNKIIIDHGNNLKTLYAQLQKIQVEPGQKVTQYDIIGTVGSSGTSTGPHLHYEVLQGDIHVNPKPYLSK